MDSNDPQQTSRKKAWIETLQQQQSESTSSTTLDRGEVQATWVGAWRKEITRLVNTVDADIVKDSAFSKTKLRRAAGEHFQTQQEADLSSIHTQEAIPGYFASTQSAREREFERWLWQHIGTQRPKRATPTKAKMWRHLGYAQTYYALDDAPSGAKLHMSISEDAMRAPSYLEQSNADVLQWSPEALFDQLFLSMDVQWRVHVTREGEPKKHLYLGFVNGRNDPIAADRWGGDAATMRQHLKDFRSGVLRKLAEGKLKGWDL